MYCTGTFSCINIFKRLRSYDIVTPTDLILYITNNVRDVENESHYIPVSNLKQGLVLFNIHLYSSKVKYNVNAFFEFYYP